MGLFDPAKKPNLIEESKGVISSFITMVEKLTSLNAGLEESENAKQVESDKLLASAKEDAVQQAQNKKIIGKLNDIVS